MAMQIYKGCVYLATNTVNGSMYIGKTLMGMHVRRGTHFSAVRRGEMQPFICALRKHGAANFMWAELFRSDDNPTLMAAEIELIAVYKAAGHRLYNATAGGDGASRIRSEAEKERMRGRIVSDDAKQRIRDSWTPERKAAQAVILAAREMTEQQRLDISKRMTGKRMSEASIAKMAATKTGKKMAPWSEERRAKMAAARDRGCFIKTHEHKAKIAETKRARITDDERARLSELGKKGAAKRWGP